MGQATAENTTVLVTGGSGLIGRAVTDNLLGRGARVVVFDAASSAHDGQAGVTHVQASVLDVEALDEVFAREKVGAVIHLASLLSPPTSAAPRNGVLVNSMGTLNVFEAARDHEVRRVVWASSSSVFGRRDGYEAITGKTIVGDEDLLSPQDLYGGTKAFNEVLGLHYRGRGLDVVGLRPVLTYGPGPQSGAVGQLVDAVRALAEGRPGHVPLPWQRGTRINPIFALDCGDLFVETCLHPEPFDLPAYNTGTGEFATVGEIIDVAGAVAGGGTVTFEADDAQAGDPSLPAFDFVDLDSTGLRSKLGWAPRYTLQQGVEACIEGFRRQAARPVAAP
jgi:nucleoside-diphosphate-sugar epimerase